MCRVSSVTALAVLAGLCGAACKQTALSDQPREEPLAPSRFFPDGSSARTPVAGTIPRGELRLDRHLYEGLAADGQLATDFPFALDRGDLERGRERYDAFCSPCHGFVGEGDGMIVRRGFPLPPTLHSEYLRDIAPGHLYLVITRGAAAMPSYRAQIPPEDRWRIVGYMRALQRSQFASREDVPDDQWALLSRERQGEGDGGD
jgi:mono/diheme cytochrome c family protein